MNIWLKEIEIDDGIEYFNLLNELASYPNVFAKPIPDVMPLEDFLDYKKAKIKMKMEGYKGSSPVSTYWVMNNDEPIGYATLKHYADYEKIGGHFGLCLKNEYQNMGIGTKVSSMLSQIAYEDLGLEEVIYTSKKENIQSQKSLENIGAEYVLEKDGYYFYKVNLNKVLGKGDRK